MTADNQANIPWETDTTRLLARLPDVPHIGSYGRKDTIIQPYIKGNEIDPKKPKNGEEKKK